LYNLLRQKTPLGYSILADSAFPFTNDLQGKIISCPKEDVLGKINDIKKLAYFQAVTRERQAAEWGMRAIQASFSRLKLPLPADKTRRARLLRIILKLHNLRTNRVGMNQIKTVYYDIWIQKKFNHFKGEIK